MRHRRLLAALLAAYSVVVASGAPLPFATVALWVIPADEEATERFPCEACPCGCGTAEHCWGACCCHTLAERLEWARREGVRPPDSALDEAERAGLEIREWRPEAVYAVRIDAPLVTEDTSKPAELPPCCRQRLACCEKGAEEPGPATPREKPPKPGVALLRAMACQGVTEAWLQLGQAPIADGPELLIVDLSVYATELPAPISRRLAEAPAAPPPDGACRIVS